MDELRERLKIRIRQLYISLYPRELTEWAEILADQILTVPEIARALEYYRLMHSQGHDVDKYYKEAKPALPLTQALLDIKEAEYQKSKPETMTELREKIEKGMYFSDRCQFCREFGEKVEPYLCSDCKERIKELGYVKLAENQELPPFIYLSGSDFNAKSTIQQCMLKAGFRKVEL